MPLGYITLLSRKGKGCRCDEMKRKPTFFLCSRHGRHRTFFPLGSYDECCSRVIYGTL